MAEIRDKNNVKLSMDDFLFFLIWPPLPESEETIYDWDAKPPA